MPSFRYSAIGPDGRLARGTMDAPTEAAVIDRLRREGSLPVRAEPSRGARWQDFLHLEFGRTGLRRQDVADLTRELATMLGAGQDLDRTLRFLAEIAPNARYRTTVEQLRATVRDGGSLAAALALHPASFPPLYVGLVRAGEAGGQLAATLDRLAILLERQRSLASTVTSALIYPTVLLVAATGSIALLLTEVLPQFVPLFQQSGAQLPRPTRILIALGAATGQYGLWVLLALAIAGLVARSALQRPGPRLAMDRLVLRLPVAGGLAREIVAARLTRTLGTLLLNGVPLIAALGIARDVVGNRAGMRAIDSAALSAKGGAGLSTALAASRIFPVRTVHLLRLGEETAQLGPMALRAAEIHEEATRLGVQRLVSLLVPAITIGMGAAIAGIVSSLMLAMLGLNDLAH